MAAQGLRFVHVAINCKDPITVERFYTKHFGFQRARVVELGGGQQIVFIKSGTMYLEMFQTDQPAPHPPVGGDGPEYPCWRHIAFQVDDVDAKLESMGSDLRISKGPMTFYDFIPGWKTVWITDPEGNVIEVSQGYVDQENPPRLR